MAGEGAEGEGAAARRARACPAAWALAAALSLLSACGLEEYVVLEPPSGPSYEGADFTFSHNIENDSFEFLGYEVFYRLYESLAKAQTEAAAIESSWTSLPPSTIVGRLKSRAFKRIAVDGQERIPVFPIDDAEFGDSIAFTLSFTAAGESSRNASQFTIRRFATDENQEHRSFGDLTYSDLDCQTAEASPDSPFLLVYAYAYGIDDDFLEIYSQVVRLGTIGFELTPE